MVTLPEESSKHKAMRERTSREVIKLCEKYGFKLQAQAQLIPKNRFAQFIFKAFGKMIKVEVKRWVEMVDA